MAFSVRLTGFDAKTGGEILRMEPPWWPANVLKDDPRMRQSVSNGYLDYQATLTVSDARNMHLQFLPNACHGVFECTQWQASLKPMLAELDVVFGPRLWEFGRFEVCVFEWESGL